MDGNHVVGAGLQAVALFHNLVLQAAGGNLHALVVLVLFQILATQTLVFLGTLLLQVGEEFGDDLLGFVKGHFLLCALKDGSQAIGKVVDIQLLDA